MSISFKLREMLMYINILSKSFFKLQWTFQLLDKKCLYMEHSNYIKTTDHPQNWYPQRTTEFHQINAYPQTLTTLSV